MARNHVGPACIVRLRCLRRRRAVPSACGPLTSRRRRGLKRALRTRAAALELQQPIDVRPRIVGAHRTCRALQARCEVAQRWFG
jgi:hypothetical protein